MTTVAQLSERQRQVAMLVASGLTNKQIAVRLVVSPHTAKAHVERVLRAVGASNRTHAAAIVWREVVS